MTVPKGLYRHFKGGLYEVLGQVIHSETEEVLVLYRHVDQPQLWVRPVGMFTEHLKNSTGEEYLRFVFLGPAVVDE